MPRLPSGDASGAADLYAHLLVEDPANVPALAGLARCYVETGAIEQAKQTLALVPEAKRNEAPVAAARAALDLSSRRSRSARSTSSSRRSPPIRSTIRRASISRWRLARPGSVTRRSIICSRSCGATASGTRTARASSSCNCSRRGDRPTRRRSMAASGSRRSCSLETNDPARPRLAYARRPGTGFRDHADERGLSRAHRPSAHHPGVPAAGRAAAAARADAAQYLRAALSRHGRRRACRRAPADRHDPARHRASRAGGEAGTCSRSAASAASPSSPRAATAAICSSSPASPASASRKNSRSRPPTGNAASPMRRSPTTSSRARARTMWTAKRC